MNSIIRALTRLAREQGLEVVGFRRGWDGLRDNDFTPLTERTVGGILHLGGTMLQTSRSNALRTKEGIQKAGETLRKHDIQDLVVIGGNGSMKSSLILSSHEGTRIIGIPATIDNDVYGTKETIGFDTAVNTTVNLVDKIRDTAKSMNRVFVVEVMGRKHGSQRVVSILFLGFKRSRPILQIGNRVPQRGVSILFLGFRLSRLVEYDQEKGLQEPVSILFLGFRLSRLGKLGYYVVRHK